MFLFSEIIKKLEKDVKENYFTRSSWLLEPEIEDEDGEREDFEVRDEQISENEDKPLISGDELLESDDELADSDGAADEAEDVPNRNRQFHRRKKKYAVSSIATSLDEENYDITDYCNIDAKEIEVPLEKKGKKVTKKITWTTEKPNQGVRQNQQNVIPNRLGVKPEHRDIVDSLSAWWIFIDDNTIKLIVTYTNQSINKSIRQSKQNKASDKQCHLIETNEREIKAFVGLWYIRVY